MLRITLIFQKKIIDTIHQQLKTTQHDTSSSKCTHRTPRRMRCTEELTHTEDTPTIMAPHNTTTTQPHAAACRCLIAPHRRIPLHSSSRLPATLPCSASAPRITQHNTTTRPPEQQEAVRSPPVEQAGTSSSRVIINITIPSSSTQRPTATARSKKELPRG